MFAPVLPPTPVPVPAPAFSAAAAGMPDPSYISLSALTNLVAAPPSCSGSAARAGMVLRLSASACTRHETLRALAHGLVTEVHALKAACPLVWLSVPPVTIRCNEKCKVGPAQLACQFHCCSARC